MRLPRLKQGGQLKSVITYRAWQRCLARLCHFSSGDWADLGLPTDLLSLFLSLLFSCLIAWNFPCQSVSCSRSRFDCMVCLPSPSIQHLWYLSALAFQSSLVCKEQLKLCENRPISTPHSGHLVSVFIKSTHQPRTGLLDECCKRGSDMPSRSPEHCDVMGQIPRFIGMTVSAHSIQPTSPPCHKRHGFGKGRVMHHQNILFHPY